VATFLDLPATYDYVIILFVFSSSFLQPVLQQPTDLYEIELDWNRSHTAFKPGRVRRLTRTGEQGWVIPEFAWDPTGRRLLWTQNKFNDGRRVDQGCIMRKLRANFVRQLAGVDTIGEINGAIVAEVRQQAMDLLRDPATYPHQGLGCGGEQPNQQPNWSQETRVGRYE